MKNKNMVLESIQKIFRQVLNDDELIIDNESNTSSVAGWDSVTNISLIVAIEEEFKIEFPIEVIYESTRIDDWLNYIVQSSND